MRKQLSNSESSPLNTLTYRVSFKTKHLKVFGPSLLKIGFLGTEFKKKNSNSESTPLSAPMYIVSFKTKYFKVSESNLSKKDALIFIIIIRSSHPEVFLRNGFLKICSKFTGQHPCRSVISLKLFCNVIETALRDGCSSVNLLHIFRTPFLKNTSGWLLLDNHSHNPLVSVNMKRFTKFRVIVAHSGS